MKLFPLLPRYVWHVRLSMLKINTHIQTCLHTFYQATVKISRSCQMIILCNHGEVRNKTTFSRIISGLIAFDSRSMCLFTCLLNLGGCKCLGYPWSIYFPFACVWCWQSLNTPSQPLQGTRGLSYAAGMTEALLLLWQNTTHLHPTWLVDFGCFTSSAFNFSIHIMWNLFYWSRGSSGNISDGRC